MTWLVLDTKLLNFFLKIKAYYCGTGWEEGTGDGRRKKGTINNCVLHSGEES